MQRLIGWSALVAIALTPLLSTAAMAQMTTLPVPYPGGPQIQPPRPTYPGGPQPVQPSPGWGGNGQYEQTIRCASNNNRYRECRADASGGADIIRVVRGNCNQNNWGYRANAVWVRNGCQADIGVRSANFGGGNGGGWQGDNGNWQTANVRCESRGYRYQTCRADARGGAQITQVIAGDCRRGNWGWRETEIWVDRGCRADFLVRGTSQQPSQGGGGGPSAGTIIGGVAIAAGLAALIAAATKKKAPEATTAPEAPLPAAGSTGPATVNISTSVVPTAARPAFQTCLNEAAKQIGATGGTAISLGEMQEIVPGNGGHRFRFTLTGTWPDETRTISAYCRATPTSVVQLDFS